MPMPIDPFLAEITATLGSSPSLILTATPGAGKTTRLPPELLNIVGGKVIVLQPRRMAAVAACERVAEERGWTVGGEVGYQVRFDSRCTSHTRLVFMTDALLVRKMLDDSELSGVDIVVIDEFHERGLNQDLILGCLRELQELGRAIKILVMSATLEAGRLLEFLPGSRHIAVPGEIFPLTVRHTQQPLSLQLNSGFYERVVQATQSAMRESHGDILVFLPGQGEIAQLARRLESAGRAVVPLHGSLPLAQQRQVLQAPSEPRVILATNVAEASMTVQGVDFVIDTGVAKVMKMNPHSGFSTLELTRISRFNARQRAGRAARQKAGVCLRLWTSFEETTQLQELPPEAQRADLSAALLFLAHLGVTNFARFAWLDAPPRPLLEICVRHLVKLGSLDAESRLTDLGRQLLRFPLEARWGALLSLAEREGLGEAGAQMCALLSERDIVYARDQVSSEGECDLQFRMSLLDDDVKGLDRRAVTAVLDSCRQLNGLILRPGASAWQPDQITRLLLRSQRDRLCRRRGETFKGLMVGGRGVRLDQHTHVRHSGFFIALNGVDLPGQAETLVSLASGVSKAQILEHLREQIVVDEQILFIEEKGEFFAQRTRSIDGLALEEPSLTPVPAHMVRDQLAVILARKWEWLASQNAALGRWLSRWKFFVQYEPDFASALGEEQIGKALALAAFGKTKVTEVVAENLVSFVEMAMAPEAVAEMHQQVPDKFIAPSGALHLIDYEIGQPAYVDVRLQEIFGLSVSPTLVGGKIPLTFRLLAPNYRPVQVTSDLANFWRKGYLEVRKELRTRYPKHSWPDDPLTARPEAKGRRRS